MKGMGKCVMAGGLWPLQRRFEAGKLYSPLCQRCGQQPEDELHRIWGCAANDSLPDRAVVDTQWLRARATQEADAQP
eukprot:6414535-Lingulodinium_polyedra.AAC.1